MRTITITRFLAGLFLALAIAPQGLAQSSSSRPADACESATSKISLSDLEVLARAEQRAESLRAKLFELQMQELDLQVYIDDLDYRMTPDSIQQALAFAGSARPMDELRNDLRARLENEKARVNKQLELFVTNRERVEAAVSRADAEVERLRQRLTSQ